MQVQLQSLDHVSEISSMETHHVFGNACWSRPAEVHTVRERPAKRDSQRYIQSHSDTFIQSNVQIVQIQSTVEDQGSEVQSSTVHCRVLQYTTELYSTVHYRVLQYFGQSRNCMLDSHFKVTTSQQPDREQTSSIPQ